MSGEQGVEAMQEPAKLALRVGRRKLLGGASGTLSTARVAGATLAWAHAGSCDAKQLDPLLAPKPIPWRHRLRGVHPHLHPRTGSDVLAFTSTPLLGFNVEPSTITHFRGDVALTYLLGSAKTSDGRQDFVGDVRVMKGALRRGKRQRALRQLRRVLTGSVRARYGIPDDGDPSVQLHDIQGGIPPSVSFGRYRSPMTPSGDR